MEGDQSELIDQYSSAVLERREELKFTSKSPKDILTRSYGIIETQGFRPESAKEMADTGNEEYLKEYTKASETTVRVNKQGKTILEEAKNKNAENYS